MMVQIYTKVEALQLYFSNLITSHPGTLNISVQMAAVFCQHFEVSPDTLYSFLRAFCKDNNIHLIEGGH